MLLQHFWHQVVHGFIVCILLAVVLGIVSHVCHALLGIVSHFARAFHVGNVLSNQLLQASHMLQCFGFLSWQVLEFAQCWRDLEANVSVI